MPYSEYSFSKYLESEQSLLSRMNDLHQDGSISNIQVHHVDRILAETNVQSRPDRKSFWSKIFENAKNFVQEHIETVDDAV